MFDQHLSIHNYEKKVIRYLKDEWDSKLRNEKELFTYKGKPLVPETMKNPNFIKVVIYIGELFRSCEYNNRSELLPQFDERIRKELIHWESEGQLCLHLTILSYFLFEEFGLFTDKEMKLVQGYYFHEARRDNPLAVAIGNIHVGIHSWLSVKGSVIDLTIAQEREFFDFKGMDVILGEVPEGMLLKGFQEPRKIAQRHLLRYANYIGLTPKEYLSLHKEECSSLFAKTLLKE